MVPANPQWGLPRSAAARLLRTGHPDGRFLREAGSWQPGATAGTDECVIRPATEPLGGSGTFFHPLRDLQNSSAPEAGLILAVLLSGAAFRTAQAHSGGSSAPAFNVLREPRERLVPSHALPRPALATQLFA